MNLDAYSHYCSPGEQNRPTIAGITASLDISLVSYWAQTRIQPPGLSAIQDLGIMVEVCSPSFPQINLIIYTAGCNKAV